MSREKETNPSKGYAAVFATVFLWSTPSLFQFYLLRYYEPWSQNFYRYSVAFLAIVPFIFLRRRRGGLPLGWNAVVLCLPACLPNVVHQVTQVMALFYMGPGVYAIFNRSSVIITALLALAFFPEERWIIRQWRFQAGTLLGFIGAIGVIAFQPGWQGGHFDWRGLLIAFIATFCWALYGVLVKRPSAELGSVRSFGTVSFLTSLMLLPLTVVFGKIATPLHVSGHVNLILIISAVLCISIAHVLYYIAIREIGVALSQTLQLLCPVGALGLSVLIFHERLTHAQLWSAALLLFGAFLATRVRPAATATTAENL